MRQTTLRNFALWLLITTTWMPAASPQSADSISHRFQSGLGFSYEVPQDLMISNSEQINSAVRDGLRRRELNEGEAKSVACGQALFMAKKRDDTKIVAITMHHKECFGNYSLAPNILPQIGSSALVELNKLFVLSSVHTAISTIGKHSIWIMKSDISPKNPQNPNKYMAVMIVPTPEGLAEFILTAKDRTDMRALMATQVRFDDGAEGEIVPSEAFPLE